MYLEQLAQKIQSNACIYATRLNTRHRLRATCRSRSRIPDFEGAYASFLEEHLGFVDAPRNPEDDPAPQSSVMKLVKGLVVLKYGKDILEDLSSKRSEPLSVIERDLEQEGYRLDRKTLSRYLKNLPD